MKFYRVQWDIGVYQLHAHKYSYKINNTMNIWNKPFFFSLSFFQVNCLLCCCCLFRCHTCTKGSNLALSFMVSIKSPLSCHLMVFLPSLACLLMCFSFFFSFFPLSHYCRFDVALLAPLSSPVLALQHVIVPICLPSEG